MFIRLFGRSWKIQSRETAEIPLRRLVVSAACSRFIIETTKVKMLPVMLDACAPLFAGAMDSLES
jgi:hypothetical protein